MLESPEAVLLYIPLMKEIGMSWNEIKCTPRRELDGLLSACHEYKELHSMDGYTEKQVADMSKDNPQVRSQYIRYLEKKRKLEDRIGLKRNNTFKGV
mgnify:CR=1 FL=1|jgi:hypothetical protein|tara:strand:- start:58 stop:348 length:291 start_codon:yes stop_codon:yes gene_type:complete